MHGDEKLLIFALSEQTFWLSGQNPERSKTISPLLHFEKGCIAALLLIISSYESFQEVFVFNRTTFEQNGFVAFEYKNFHSIRIYLIILLDTTC